MFRKGKPKTGGRKPGVVNKATASVKEAFAEAFDKLGGAEALVAWGRENPTDFYKLASKLIPTDVNMALVEHPEARVYPLGNPEHEQDRLPAAQEAMDSVH